MAVVVVGGRPLEEELQEELQEEELLAQAEELLPPSPLPLPWQQGQQGPQAAWKSWAPCFLAQPCSCLSPVLPGESKLADLAAHSSRNY